MRFAFCRRILKIEFRSKRTLTVENNYREVFCVLKITPLMEYFKDDKVRM